MPIIPTDSWRIARDFEEDPTGRTGRYTTARERKGLHRAARDPRAFEAALAAYRSWPKEKRLAPHPEPPAK